MDDRIERLAKWASGGRAGPYQIEFHPTNLCNCNCIMCGTRAEHRRLKREDPKFDAKADAAFELKPEEGVELVRQSAGLGVRRWLLTGGGEPFYNKRLTLAMMHEIKGQGMFGNLNTNGGLITEKDIDEMISISWDMLMFSIDSDDASDHDRIRATPGIFRKADAVMRSIKAKKKAAGARLPKVVFNTVLSNRLCGRIDRFIEYASDVGCEDITFIPLITFDDESSSLAMSERERDGFQERIDGYIALAKKKDLHTNLPSMKQKRIDTTQMDRMILKDAKAGPGEEASFAGTPCFEPYLNLVIRMNGLVSPCCMLENFEENVRKKSLEDIWYGKYFTGLRESLQQGRLQKGCRNCVFSATEQNSDLRKALRARDHA